MAEAEHFLDAAILIGRFLPWDAQSQCVSAYFGRAKRARHTSRHVYAGVRRTLTSIRLNFGSYMVELETQLRSFEQAKLSQQVRDHMEAHIRARSAAGQMNANQAGQLRLLVRLFYNQIRTEHLGNARLERLAADVDRTVQTALNMLDAACKPDAAALIVRHDCPRTVRTTYAGEHGKVHAAMGAHDDDALVAIEALHLHRTVSDKIRVLVTTDRAHFLSKKHELDAILSPVSVSHPDHC